MNHEYHPRQATAEDGIGGCWWEPVSPDSGSPTGTLRPMLTQLRLSRWRRSYEVHGSQLRMGVSPIQGEMVLSRHDLLEVMLVPIGSLPETKRCDWSPSFCSANSALLPLNHSSGRGVPFADPTGHAKRQQKVQNHTREPEAVKSTRTKAHVITPGVCYCMKIDSAHRQGLCSTASSHQKAMIPHSNSLCMGP